MTAIPKPTDPGGGQVTIFDLFGLVAPALAFALAFGYADSRWGLTAGALLGLFGLIAGAIIARLPMFFALQGLCKQLKRCSTDTLKERLAHQYYISHFIVPVLLSRGESPGELKKSTLNLMLSETSHKRWHGWRTLNLCFPELAVELKDIDVRGELRAYKTRIERLIAGLEQV